MSVSNFASFSLQSTMDLDLPEEVLQVESHLSWISKILSSVATELKLDDPTAKRDYVTRLLIRKNQPLEKGSSGESPDENELEDDDEVETTEMLEHKYEEQTRKQQWPLYVSQELNNIAMAAYVRDYEFATKKLTQIQKLVDQLTGVHKDRLLEVAGYCIDALEWSIVKIQEKSSDKVAGGDGNNVEVSKDGNEDERLNMLQEKCDCFLNDSKTLLLTAVIKYWRGNLERDLLPFSIYPREEDLKILREIIRMDSEYYMWYHFAVESQRRLHRFNAKLEVKVAQWCEKAFKLAPEALVTNYDFALHLKDKIRGRNAKAARIGIADFEKCVTHFRAALDLATRYEMRYWIMKIESELGELLACYSGNNVCIEEGVAMLRNCLERHPNDAYLDQKLARIYHQLRGVKTFPGGNCVFKDAEKAEYHYKRALEKKWAINYLSCLKGYLNLLPDLGTLLTPAAVLALLTSSISFLKSDETDERVVSSGRKESEAAFVRVWRACYLWQYNPEQDPNHKMKAREEWIAVLKDQLRYHKAREKTLESIWKPPFSKMGGIFYNYEMRTSDLKMQLENIKGNANDDKDTLAAVSALSEYVPNIGSHTDIFTNQEHGDAVATGGRRFPKVDNAYRQGQYWQGQNQRRALFWNDGKGACKADMDDNWRA